MLPVFDTFGKHPLLLQLLAYEVAEFRDVPGDFDAWQAAAFREHHVRPGPFAYCEDCTPEYQTEMKLQERCANPTKDLTVFG